jgi:pimeloyl-ACP methyl ester carboxylesterase
MKLLANGQLVEYSDQGKGKVVVLLHGWGANLHTFDDIAKQLAKNYRVIRIDFPGFGASAVPPQSWRIADYAVLTAEVLEKIGVSSVYALIGHSFGGRVTIKSISIKSVMPDKVVLIGAAGIRSAKTVKKTIYKVVAKAGKAVTAVPGLRQLRSGLRERLYKSAGSTDYLNAGQMKKVFLSTINEDLLPEVSSITQPTLLIWGEQDSETPLSDAYTMRDHLPNAKLVIYPDAGHFVYQEKEKEVMEELEKFL